MPVAGKTLQRWWAPQPAEYDQQDLSSATMGTTTSTSRTAATRGPTLGESGSTRTLDRRGRIGAVGGRRRRTRTASWRCRTRMRTCQGSWDTSASRVQLLLLRHHQARLYEDGIGRHAHARGHRVQPAGAPRWHHRRQESKVYTPPASMTGCTEEWVCHLAKAYVNVLAQRASGTHWLNTHAVMMEPCFVIASSPPTSRLDI